MIRHIGFFGLLGFVVVAGAGCHGLGRGQFLCPFGPGCDPQYCCDSCGPTCGSECEPACGTDCGPVCGPACGPACAPACGPAGCYHGPLTWVFNLFRCGNWWGCMGCGETYWGGYCDTPPDCCDPCDCQGNWTGGTCGGGVIGGDYPMGAPVVGPAPMPGNCPTCGQSHEESALAGQVVSRVGPKPAPAGAPHLAPRQAWRARTSTVQR